MAMSIEELRESLGLPPATPGVLVPPSVAADRDAISRPRRVDPERVAEALEALRAHRVRSGDQLRRHIRRPGDTGEFLRAILDAVGEHPNVHVKHVARRRATPGRRFIWRHES